jgi:hypothetical protein
VNGTGVAGVRGRGARRVADDRPAAPRVPPGHPGAARPRRRVGHPQPRRRPGTGGRLRRRRHLLRDQWLRDHRTVAASAAAQRAPQPRLLLPAPHPAHRARGDRDVDRHRRRGARAAGVELRRASPRRRALGGPLLGQLPLHRHQRQLLHPGRRALAGDALLVPRGRGAVLPVLPGGGLHAHVAHARARATSRARRLPGRGHRGLFVVVGPPDPRRAHHRLLLTLHPVLGARPGRTGGRRAGRVGPADPGDQLGAGGIRPGRAGCRARAPQRHQCLPRGARVVAVRGHRRAALYRRGQPARAPRRRGSRCARCATSATSRTRSTCGTSRG